MVSILGPNGLPAPQRSPADIAAALEDLTFAVEEAEREGYRGEQAPPPIPGLVPVRERLASLEFALEDADWRRLGAGDRAISKDDLNTIVRRARRQYLRNPLIQRGIDVQADYIWGQEWSVGAPDAVVERVITLFMEDEDNTLELTSQQARLEKEVTLRTDGNIFFLLFPDRMTGSVKVRTLPVEEIARIHTDPEDRRKARYYERHWRSGDGLRAVERKALYPDWRYTPREQQPTGNDLPVEWSSPIYHVRTGGDLFGIPDVWAAIDWALATREFYEDWATITRALSRFAFRLTVSGGNAAIAKAKSRLQTTLSTSGTSAETNPPPTVGSMFIQSGGTELEPMRVQGATVSVKDGRELKLMVCAALGIPETFLGDVSVGSLATARSLDRPTELRFRNRQLFWADVFGNLLRYALLTMAQAVRPLERLAGRIEVDADARQRFLARDQEGAWGPPRIDFDFPPLLQHDISEKIAALVDVMTLRGQTRAGTFDDETFLRLALAGIGEDDLSALVPEIMARVQADQAPARAQGEEQPSGIGAAPQSD